MAKADEDWCRIQAWKSRQWQACACIPNTHRLVVSRRHPRPVSTEGGKADQSGAMQGDRLRRPVRGELPRPDQGIAGYTHYALRICSESGPDGGVLMRKRRDYLVTGTGVPDADCAISRYRHQTPAALAEVDRSNEITVTEPFSDQMPGDCINDIGVLTIAMNEEAFGVIIIEIERRQIA